MTMDSEKVIKGLELCEIGSGDRCYETECPYYRQGCTESLKNEILELLKEQKKSIPISWLTEKLEGHPELPYAVTDGIINVLELWKGRQSE